MTGKQKGLADIKKGFWVPGFTGLTFLICTFLLVGCDHFGGGASKEVKEMQAEKEKAALLKRIDRKFENPEAHFELGKLYQADGLWAQAEYRYNVVLSFDPSHKPAQAAMVKVLAESGDAAKSALTAEIYINQVSASAGESLRLGLAFQREQMDDYALACYQQALHLAPNSAKINRQIGYYYLSKNDKVRAQEYLSRSFQLDPSQAEVAGELGRLGVGVRIPRKTGADAEKLDKIVEKADKKIQP